MLNSVEWIKSAPWDGLPHIDNLIDTVECPLDFPDDMKTTLMTKWLVSGVAAVCEPGRFSARGVLLLQGEQAIGKTSWFRRLCPRDSGWFGEGLILDPADKDSLKQFVSHWIVELGELEGTLRKTDIARLKSFITRDYDLTGLPWARKMSEFPRRTISPSFCWNRRWPDTQTTFRRRYRTAASSKAGQNGTPRMRRA
jgi:putative DNA primase/helicase